MRKIKLAIFNEAYWDNGLIYTQNILPLVNLSKEKPFEVSIVSFTSLPMLILERNNIKRAKKDLAKLGIRIYDFPMLFYPTRFMILRYALIPFYLLNIFFYIRYLVKVDNKEEGVVYNIRSYQAALGFYKFYPNKNNLMFDLRTDWIEENINRGLFKKESKTVRYWEEVEKGIIMSFAKSLFISPEFRDNVLNRHNIECDNKKHVILYNPIDYNHFQSVEHNKNAVDFLYTGSLGHWNSLNNYLDFFLSIANEFPSSKLIVCTASPENKVTPYLRDSKYDEIRDRVVVYYNIPYEDLPKYYSQCKYGLQIMNKKDSRVGVKFIEYIASGVVPIVHENVRGATNMSKTFNIGITFNDDDMLNISNLSKKIHSVKCIDYDSREYKEFKAQTDLNSITDRLSHIYE